MGFFQHTERFRQSFASGFRSSGGGREVGEVQAQFPRPLNSGCNHLTYPSDGEGVRPGLQERGPKEGGPGDRYRRGQIVSPSIRKTSTLSMF